MPERRESPRQLRQESIRPPTPATRRCSRLASKLLQQSSSSSPCSSSSRLIDMICSVSSLSFW